VKRVLASLLLVSILLSGCSNEEQYTVSKWGLDSYTTGEEFVQSVINSLVDDSTWKAPVPPSGGEKPRLLTDKEKDQVLKLAAKFYPVYVLTQMPDVTLVETRYLWIGWIGHADGESFLDLEPIENGIVSQENIDSMGVKCYPTVSYYFHSQYDDTNIAGIYVAVNLDTGKIVFTQGFIASNLIPPKPPPP
jgi:hypothetical protein